MNIIEKILSFLNKPTHYLFVGLTFSCWAFFVEKNSTGTNMFIGIVLLSLAFAFFVEWCFKNLQVFLKHKKPGAENAPGFLTAGIKASRNWW